MLYIYCLTIFVSSSLLFLLQPLFARIVLPVLGGSPSVWNTCMVFFQAALLAGYAYAHGIASRLSWRNQAMLHACVLLLPLLVLPFGMPGGWSPPTGANPIPWLLALLTITVGLPFFAVATTSPLLQRWFSATGSTAGRDPYFLYATSNVGSMLALLSYPFLLEPTLTLESQRWLWAGGYVVLIGLTLVCAWSAFRTPGHPAIESTDAKDEATIINWSRRLRWIALSAVPSSLLLGLTAHVTTDIAAVPLFWVLPLALYLLTFILAFSSRGTAALGWLHRVTPLAIILVVLTLGRTSTQGGEWWLLALNVAAAFFAMWACHAELAADRPPPRRLTEFYLMLSVGGVLGGCVNALLAPVLFDSILEYPLALVAVCLLRPRQREARPGAAAMDLLLPASLALVIIALVWVFGAKDTSNSSNPISLVLILGLPAVVCYTFSDRPVRLALGVAALLLVSVAYELIHEPVLFAKRSFFGVHRVTDDRPNEMHRLVHGTTLHGWQSTNPSLRRTGMSYYHRTGPLGQVFATFGGDANKRKVGILGLGSGGVSPLAGPEQHLTFFEIDPVVVQLAEDTSLFTYLADLGKHRYQLVLGDGRLTLAESREKFGIILVDVFTSDSIPVHLLTREALRSYLSKLDEGGILVFNISSRFFRLEPLMGGLADDARLSSWVRADLKITEEENRQGKSPSTFAVMARKPEDVKALASDPRWRRVDGERGNIYWTDDFVNILQVLGR
jgi:hypothetical protein